MEHEMLDFGGLCSAKEAFERLRPFWDSVLERERDFKIGEVKLIHANRRSGTIKAEGGAEFFFGKNEVVDRDQSLTPMTEVRFELKQEYDRKRNRFEMHACRIQILNLMNHGHRS